MIRTDQELQFVREQLGRVEAALQDLEEQVRPRSPKRFNLLAEAYLIQIEKLRREIDDYSPGRGGAARAGTRARAGGKRRTADALRLPLQFLPADSTYCVESRGHR